MQGRTIFGRCTPSFGRDYCAFFRGRRTSSPPQFGQIDRMAWVQSAQKVHSKVQMKAVPVGESGAWHFSHWVRISRAMVSPPW
jgi:hypothetical protein